VEGPLGPDGMRQRASARDWVAESAAERRLAGLFEAARAVTRGDGLESVLGSVAETMARVLGFPYCAVYEHDPVSGGSCPLAVYDRWESAGSVAPGGRIVVPMDFAGRRVGSIELGDLVAGRALTSDELALAQAMADQAVSAIEHAKRVDELRQVHLDSLCTLASALNAKDAYTHGHASRVAVYAAFLCRELGVEEALISELEKACYLHDIGKIGITDRILQKRGRLNDEERALMQRHADISARIVSPLFSREVLSAVRHHHESWDGSGYPDGLRGSEISLLARILHIADSYDAMSYSRPYARPLTYSAALRELREGAGREFDPSLVPPFTAILERMRAVRERARAVAQEAAALIDGDEHARLVSRHQEESDSYQRMVVTLRRVRDAYPEVAHISTAVLHEDCARFVLDAEEDEERRSHIGDPYLYELDSPMMTPVWRNRVRESDLFEQWFRGEENVLYVDQWGIWLSGTAPVRDGRGAVVAGLNVDIPAAGTQARRGPTERVFHALMGDREVVTTTWQVLAITDELTGLYNHGAFQDRLERELDRAAETDRPLSVLLLDIDDFSALNHRLGHGRGDELLHELAQGLLDVLRPSDICARYGGEEFAVILMDVPPTTALAIAERLRAALGGPRRTATLSIGLASRPRDACDKEGLLRAAEAALDQAKRLGKDRVVAAVGAGRD
jgi:diguanylate cyclase (GGDEF)-like protein